MSNFLFTSESVTEGHPDKICDNISDSVLDAILKKDKNARVACETLVTTGLVLVTGEITTDCYVDVEKIARNTIKSIGYDKSDIGFSYDSCSVLTSFKNQSSDIALGVDIKDNKPDIGAGDQGMMFGFACDQSDDFMPLPIYFAHKLTKRLAFVRKNNILKYLRPDGKAQITIEYQNDKPARIDCIVISAQHESDCSDIKDDIIREVILKSIDQNLLDDKTKIYVNPTGRFVIGGPLGDSGLTGRKIIVDTYGGYARHGGGAFSGKDATKVDRCGAYIARYVAKNIVANGLAKKCEVQVAYAIGVSKPVSIFIDTFGTNKNKKLSDDKIKELVSKKFDFRPAAIIERFDLKSPIYNQVSNYGHFGRNDLDLPWEKIDTGIFL